MAATFTEDSKQCVVCGNDSCTEAYDHSRVDMRTLQRLLQMGRVPTKRMNEIIGKVRNHY
jgi:hypothetical protein